MTKEKDLDPNVVSACTECGTIQSTNHAMKWGGVGPCRSCGGVCAVTYRDRVRKLVEKTNEKRGIPND